MARAFHVALVVIVPSRSTSRHPTSWSESASATLSGGVSTLKAVESASAVVQSGATTDALAIRSVGWPVRGSTMC